MKRVTNVVHALLLSGALVACRGEATKASAAASSRQPAPSTSASNRASDAAPTVVHAPPVASAELANAPGPAPSGSAVAREMRETAVLALLSDVTLVRRAPLVDLEPGREFEWELRDRVAPRLEIPNGKIVMKDTRVDGPLPVVVVKRIVRQNFGRFRTCYGDGLARKADLEGTITIELVIEPDGRVSSSKSASTTLADPDVVRCIVRSLENLVFPVESTRSTVVHAMTLAPQ